MSLDQSHRAPALRYDQHGHVIPPTEEERRARSEALKRALAAMAAIPDDPAESDEEFWRAIDAGRPERPLFQRYYTPDPIRSARQSGLAKN